MRLIGGFLHLDGRPAERRQLDAMEAAMTPPNLSPRATRHVDGPVALLTLDFSPSDRPARGVDLGDGPIVLAADLTPEDDGATNLASLLEREGPAGLARLGGDFACAAWDARQRTLLCARDGFGVRSFFYVHEPDRLFAFASLPRGLHSAGLAPRELDEDAIIDELLHQPRGPEVSLFVGLKRLTPGGWLRIGLGRPVTGGRFWRPGQIEVGAARLTPKEAAATLSSLVTDAVRRRLPTSGTAAAHLTGGLDSSALSVLAARELRPSGRRLLAYSLAPRPHGGHLFGGEGDFLASVLRQEPDIDWMAVRTLDPAATVLPRMDEDQLFPADPAQSEVRIFADAAARGARTLISGWGGDDAASYGQQGVLAEALATGRWSYLASELRSRGTVRAGVVALASDVLPQAAWRLTAKLMGRQVGQPVLPLYARLLRPERIAGRDLTRRPGPVLARDLRIWRLERPGLFRRIEQWSLLAARYGMTATFPLLDRRLIEFTLSLPSELFLQRGVSRRPFRDAMAGVLPEDLRLKPSKRDLTPEDALHVATQRDMLLGKLEEWRGHPRIQNLFDLDVMEDLLRGLPPADDLARILDSARIVDAQDRQALSHAACLRHGFSLLSYLADWG